MLFEYRDYVASAPQYAGMLEAMQREVAEFAAGFHDDPRLLSGWGHGYFCDDDGGRLIYDKASPLEHKCSLCGKVYTDFIYSTQFITMYRNEAVETAVKAAVLYQITRKQEYLDVIRKIIGFYAEHYKYFGIHAKDKLNCSPTVDVGGAGRMMPQGLNEAIVAIRFINALEMVKDELDPAWLAQLRRELFEPIYELLLPQKMHIHNIPIWLNSAFGILGLFFGEKEWLAEATEKPFNLYEQLEGGLTQDGFWYEGSIHYNFFALEGLMTFLVFAKGYGYAVRPDCLDKVKNMLFAAYRFAFDNDRFPNPSDGWPNIGLKTYSYVYFMGYRVYGEEVLPLLRHIAQGKLERAPLPLSEPYYYENRIALAQLIYAADFADKPCAALPPRASATFESFNCAMLRNESFNAFLKYGHQTKSHAHPDKMSVEIMVNDRVYTHDLSNSGYGTRLCKNWHRSIVAHNTCAVNGQPTDVTRPGKLLAFTDTMVEAAAQCYDGVTYDRKLQLDGKWLSDTFVVRCEQESTIDWFFHFDDAVDRAALATVPAAEELRAMYPLLMDVVRVVEPSRRAPLRRVTLENALGTMEIYLEEGAQLYLAKSYGNPANLLRDTVIVRKQGREACFMSGIRAKAGE